MHDLNGALFLRTTFFFGILLFATVLRFIFSFTRIYTSLIEVLNLAFLEKLLTT